MNAQTPIQPAHNVYGKIAAVQAELAKTGIGKDSENSAQNYKFRGIDAVYNALAPLLARHGLCILPRMVGREREERVTIKTYNGQSKESVTFYVSVEAEFDFVSADDGSIHTIRTYGEAMDNGDKATNKAMSAAYKYAALMTFAIPTEGDNDADATTHEVAPRRSEARRHSRQDAVNPPPAAPISDEQMVKLQSLIKATGTNPGALLLALGAPKGKQLSDMSRATFPKAVELLEQQLADMAKGESNAKATDFGKELDDAINF